MFAPFVAGASLTALDKTKDEVFDVRPIASGEILRRVVAKCMCATQKEQAGKYFVEGGQFGVACEAGMERVIHQTRRVVAQETSQARVGAEAHEHIEDLTQDFVILKVDLKNAFNKVSRHHMLKLVRDKFPALARWVTWCYGNDDPYLWFPGGVLRSQEGVQQGDPLGPLLFSMVIQQLVDAIRVACPNLALNCWYLDDGVIAGKAKDVLKALEVIQRLGPDLGMDLNLKKNELVKFNDGPDDFPPECERFVRNFTLLGSPIGDDQFCTEYIQAYVRKRVQHAHNALRTIRDPQVFHFLVRCCASLCKVVHLLRTVPPVFCGPALVYFDEQMREAFTQGVGVLMADAAWTQAGLATSLGGLGFRKAVDHASGAYLASVCKSAALDDWDPDEAAGYTEAEADFCARAGFAREQLQDELANTKQAQYRLSQHVDKASLSALIEGGALRDQARLRAVSSEGAGSWLTVVPSRGLNLVFAPNEFTSLLRFWLGMPVFDAVYACPWCGTAQDTFGYHALTCKKTGLKILRHNALRDTCLSQCALGGIEAESETPNLLPGSVERPADVLLRPSLEPSSLKIPNFSGSQSVCLDFACTHTLQFKTLKRASVEAGFAAADYEESVKDAKYAEECKQQGLLFVPMVVEVYGVWGKRALPVFKFITRAVANNKNLDPTLAETYLHRACSVVLQRHNAQALLRHRNPHAPTVDGPLPE